MSTRNWNRHAQAGRVRRHGSEERDHGSNLPPVSGSPRAPVMSKEQLRREADRLLAGYTGPVERVPAGVSGDSTSEKPFQTRTVSNRSTARSGRKVAAITPKPKRGKASLLKSRRPAITSATGFDTGLVIFCDGACEPNPGVGGWGFVVYRDGVEIHAECGGADPATNNTMELTGALVALRWLLENDHDTIAAPRLLCDSQYVVNGCNDWRLSWKARGWKRKGKNPDIANLDLWKALDEALTLVPIKLEWVKGHAGTVGNERADELAEEGRQSVLALRPDDTWYQLEEQLRYEVV